MFIHHAAYNPTASRRGFTLLEVIAALALITLIIGGVYGLADGALKLGASMSRARLMEQRVDAFVSQWRDWLEAAPPEFRLDAGLAKVRRGAAGALLVEGGMMPFIWRRDLRLAEAVEFVTVRGEPKGSLTLQVNHLKRLEKPTAMDEFETLAELPLLTGLKTFETQYYDAQQKRWYSSWDSRKRESVPLFMRLKFSFLSDPREHEVTFWVAAGSRQ